MERSQQQPWIQVIGQIAVRRPGREPHFLTGATRVLLAILVAAGPDGISVEEIAQAYWRNHRPKSWRISLRVTASHLSTQLPDGWDVCTDTTQFRLCPDAGFVDAWRLEAEHDEATEAPRWLARGRPFNGIEGIDLIDNAASKIIELMPGGAADDTAAAEPFNEAMNAGQQAALASQLRVARRLIITAAPERHQAITDLACADTATESHVVIGDRGLLVPLGPFTLAFPELRNQVWLERGLVDHDATTQAFRVVADALAERAVSRPQRLVVSKVHELDTRSLTLASLLIDRAPQSDFSLVLVADVGYRDLRWLDFVRRSVTAGCDLVELPH